MKRLFLISSYCDTEEKIEVLKNNLSIIKNLGWDTLLLSPIDIPQEVIKLCNFYYQTKENPVSTIDEKTYIHWRQIDTSEGNLVVLERFFPEYGWAALYQNKKLSQIGLTFDYDIYYHIIYDTKLNDNLVEEIKSNVKDVYYSNISTNGDINEFSLHYIPMSRNTMKSFESFLQKSDYIFSDDLTHDYMLKWAKKNNINHKELLIEEYINYYTDINFFSIYDENNVKVFFERYEKNEIKNKFIVYDLEDNKIDIIINNSIEFNNIEERKIIDSNLYTDEIFSIKVILNGITTECFNSYNKIVRSKINTEK